MTADVAAARAWAGAHGIALVTPDAIPDDAGFRGDPRIDYGRMVRRVPAFVLRPRSVADVIACVRYLRAADVRYALRGAGHSATGETLCEGGAVIELAGMAGVVADDPRSEEVTALAGTTWLALWEHLAAQGRRPLTLTTNTRTTLGGTLSAGGIGDAAHRFGPQATHVRRLVLVTPDGERRALAPGDPDFELALFGHGQLGVLAEVTLATWRKPSTIVGRVLRWGSLDAFLADAEEVAARGLYDVFRPRLVWREGMVRVWAVAAHLGEPGPELSGKRVLVASGVDRLDLLAGARVDHVARWPPFSPCAEIVLPYPAGVEALRAIDRVLAASRVPEVLPYGSALVLVPAHPPGGRTLPLSPFPFERNLVLALRPEAGERAIAESLQAPLLELARGAIAEGGRAYLTSFPLPADALAAQLGQAATALAGRKSAVDPGGLCNRGALHGWQDRR